MYLIHAGYYNPEIMGGLYEQHTNYFIVAKSVIDAKKRARQNSLFKKNKMHIDGIQELIAIDGYRIKLIKDDLKDDMVTYSYDIVSINQMHLPVNKQVLIHLTSKDVIHSFGIPEMRIKQDAVPGMTIPFFFTPTMTSDVFLEKIKGTKRAGQGYEIACAQLCGNSHYRMRGYVTIETDEKYDSWLAQQAEYLEGDDDDDW